MTEARYFRIKTTVRGRGAFRHRGQRWSSHYARANFVVETDKKFFSDSGDDDAHTAYHFNDGASVKITEDETRVTVKDASGATHAFSIDELLVREELKERRVVFHAPSVVCEVKGGEAKLKSLLYALAAVGARVTKVKCIKKWRQEPRSQKGVYSAPSFARKEWEAMKRRAVQSFDRCWKNAQQGGQQEHWIEEYDAADDEENEPHEQNLCERCSHLGMNCATGVVTTLILDDVPQQVRVQRKRQWMQRLARIEEPNTHKWLYHQTDRNAAKDILESQEMRRGNRGTLGGGIYFAGSPDETSRKAHAKGVILKCRVMLGRTKVIQHTDSSLTFYELVREGYDSVRYDGFSSGPEWCVYNSDQVDTITKVKSR